MRNDDLNRLALLKEILQQNPESILQLYKSHSDFTKQIDTGDVNENQ